MRVKWLALALLFILIAAAGYWFWQHRSLLPGNWCVFDHQSCRWRRIKAVDQIGYGIRSRLDQPVKTILSGETNGLWQSWGRKIDGRPVRYYCLTLVNRAQNLELRYCVPRSSQLVVKRGYQTLPQGAGLAQIKKGDWVYLFSAQGSISLAPEQKQCSARK